MASTKLFNYLLVFENILGIYRNYGNQNRKVKCLIILQILVQTIYHIINVTGELYFLLQKRLSTQTFIELGFVLSANINASVTLVSGFLYSREFQKFYRTTSLISDRFKHEKTLKRSIKTLFYVTVIITGFLITSVILRAREVYVRHYSFSDAFLVNFMFVPQLFTRITLTYQPVITYVYVMVVVNLVKCLNSLISDGQRKVSRNTSVLVNCGCDVSKEQIQDWVELYQEFSNCCEDVTICHGPLFFFTMTLLILNYVVQAYKLSYQTGLKLSVSSDAISFAIAMTTYLTSLIMPVHAGQMLRNEAMRTQRLLARLHNTILIDSNAAEPKLIKDFIRLIKKKPLEIKLLTNLPLGMYLLPLLTMFGVNYTIVVLQINHII